MGHLLTTEEAGATITRVKLAIVAHLITVTINRRVTHSIEVVNQLFRRRRIHHRLTSDLCNDCVCED